jgi:hypothetical protein
MSTPEGLDPYFDDSQDWLELVAGRAPKSCSPATRRESVWLRAALLTYRAQVPPGSPLPTEVRTARLLAQARDLGILPKIVQTHRSGWMAGPRSWLRAMFGMSPIRIGAGTVFAMVLVALFVVIPQGQRDEPARSGSQLRGDSLQRLTAPDPFAAREAMLSSLRAAGFDAQPFERLGRPGIDIALQIPVSSTQAAALNRMGLAVTGGPSMQVEFTAPEVSK